VDSYEKYEKECKRIKLVNKGLLTNFEAWLTSSGLAPKTAAKHVSNIDFFINEYLMHEEPCEACEGVDQVSSYLGHWFILHAMWASPGSIRRNAASVKKFYAFMLENGLVSQQSVDDLAQMIKQEMPKWIAQVERYDDEMDDGY